MLKIAFLVSAVGIGLGLLVQIGQPPSALRAQAQSEPASLVQPTPNYPLKISANGRYLVDQGNTAFLMVGDSPQGIIGDLSLQDADLFLANRQKYGFNTMWVNLLCNKGTGCNPDGTTFDGIPPFTNAGDLSTPNETYFAKADRIIQLAGSYGITILLDPIETIGWLDILRANGADKAYEYGRYLGQRYAASPNIVWLSGNDFQSWHDHADDALVLAVARGIQATDSTHIHTVELNYFVSASLDDPNWASLVQLDAAYNYGPTYSKVLTEYNRPTPMPIFMIEANYEWEHDYAGPQTLRRQEYWSLLSGATAGQLYGSKYNWPFPQGWKDHLDSVGSVQMTYVTALFGPRHWYDLVPDQGHSLVTSGYGTFRDSGNVNESDYATAAQSPDGTLAIVYLPTGRALTVDLSRMAGPVTARWYDPSRGRFSAAGDGTYPNTATQQFSTPGKNADGDSDWVLVLETSPL